MNGRTVILGAIISVALSLSAYSALAFNVGDVVEIKPSMIKNPAMGTWYRGKITALRSGGGFTVVADDGAEYLMYNDPRFIKTAAPASQGSASGSATGSGGFPVSAGTSSSGGISIGAGAGGGFSTGATASGATSAGGAAKSYKVGDIIEIQASMRTDPSTGLWTRGKVIALKKNGGLTVLGEDGSEYLMWTGKPQYIRPASSTAPFRPATGPSGSYGGNSTSKPSLSPGNSTGANTGFPKPNSSASDRPAKGAPPDGEYNCMKISSGSLIHLGTLEIRGGTYRGLDKTGGFAPMVINGAGNITWSQGLRGMPNGWKVYDSRYVGGDSQGRPLIQIYYRSGSGWNEMMDALKEH